MTDQVGQTNTDILSIITSLIAPEAVDSSKILHSFNDHFEASVSEILKCSELSKLVENNQDTLVCLLKKLSFIEFTSESKIKLIIGNNLTVFSLVNIPVSWKSDNIIQNLDVLSSNKNKIIRLYKKSLYWNIAIEDSSLVENLEKELNTKSFSDLDNNKIKFDKLDNKEIHNKLVKIINQNAYSKETTGLKSNHGGNSNHDGASKLSWRKKSNDTTDDFKRGSKIFKNSGNFQRTLPQGTMRDRYNSDGQNLNFRPPVKRTEEIEIDLSKIHYSLKIKHKYNNADILLFYDKYRINKIFEKEPKFEVFVDEVCSHEKRRDFNFLKRERSLTYSLPNNKYDAIKVNLDAPAFMPNRNPLTGGARLSGIQINK